MTSTAVYDDGMAMDWQSVTTLARAEAVAGLRQGAATGADFTTPGD